MTIREISERTVAYIRVARPYQGDAVLRAAERLVTWAERRSPADGQWLGYQWDNPEITSLEDCRYYVAVEAERFTPKGEVGRRTFPPMVVAEVEIRGGLDLELRALQWLYGVWLPRSGYVPDDQPCFEAWIGRPFRMASSTSSFECNCRSDGIRSVAGIESVSRQLLAEDCELRSRTITALDRLEPLDDYRAGLPPAATSARTTILSSPQLSSASPLPSKRLLSNSNFRVEEV